MVQIWSVLAREQLSVRSFSFLLCFVIHLTLGEGLEVPRLLECVVTLLETIKVFEFHFLIYNNLKFDYYENFCYPITS